MHGTCLDNQGSLSLAYMHGARLDNRGLVTWPSITILHEFKKIKYNILNKKKIEKKEEKKWKNLRIKHDKCFLYLSY